MVLDNNISKQICDFVKLKPRSVQEISLHIGKNWRTTERYVEKVEQEEGCIATRVFREGTRGALKIVYWNLSGDIHSTSFQEELLEVILKGTRKSDFTPFDVYQYVPDKNKKMYIEDASKIDPDLEISEKNDIIGFLRQANKQILIFSGNLSFIEAKQGETKIIEILRELAKKGVSIKVVSRVSMIGVDYAEKLLTLNKETGNDMVEIRHRYQPVRAIIIDNKIIKLREKRDPAYYKPNELKKKIEIFYEIWDNDWIDWFQKVFYRMFSSGMHAEKRMQEIRKIQNKLIEYK